MNKIDDEGTILTPIYKDNIYQHHVCSNCNHEMYFEEDLFVPLRFNEKIKYCPYCGKEIIRYAEPKYIEKPDFKWLEKYIDIVKNTSERIEYEIYCKNTEEERKELIERAEFGIQYFTDYDLLYCQKHVCEIIKNLGSHKIHYSEKNKLREKFGNK